VIDNEKFKKEHTRMFQYSNTILNNSTSGIREIETK
jgi:hypothetical protein